MICLQLQTRQTISIHAAQEGCDFQTSKSASVYSISIHAAQEGCDGRHTARLEAQNRISIHAAQEGCDGYRRRHGKCLNHFNPRSPRGLRRQNHDKRGGVFKFQSTQPKRAATRRWRRGKLDRGISIHAAQEGCDNRLFELFSANENISIHAAQEGCDNIRMA